MLMLLKNERKKEVDFSQGKFCKFHYIPLFFGPNFSSGRMEMELMMIMYGIA